MATTLQKKRRKQILEAASEIFAKEGLFGAELDSIAKNAEVGKGTIYRYFKNKNDLYINSIEFQSEKSFNYIDSRIKKSGSLYDLLENFIEATVDYFLKNPITFDLIVRSNNTMLFEAIGIVQRVRNRYMSKYFEYFDKAIDNDLAKPLDKSIILTMLDTCIVSLVYEHKINSKYSVKEIKSTLVSMFKTGIKK
jgi:AcrR family transcriptional regulator